LPQEATVHRLIAAWAGALALGSFAARAADPEIRFEKYQLKNGLTVILSEDHRLPQVAVDIWYHVGAANQAPGKSGFAHLFEHMMFSGSKHVQPSPFKVLESIGAGGMANGTTNFDRTNYFEVVASSELPTALWIESDRMAFLLDTLDEKKLSIQRDVVSNERRQSYENRPYGTESLRICDLLYPAPHPYYECVIGSIPEIQSATLVDLKSFFRQFYGPNNASLALVGDFDPATAKALVEKYFGPLVSPPEVQRPDLPPPQLTQVVREILPDKIAEVPRFDLVWAGVKPFADDEAAGDVLADILGGGKTSRLYRSLVFERQVASEVSAGNAALGLGGWISVGAVAKAGHGANELAPLLQAAIDEMKRDGPTQVEVERAVRKFVAQKTRQVERLGGFGGKADVLNQYQTLLGNPGYLPRDVARYRAVTPEMVKAFANRYLPDDRRIELDVEPAGKGEAGGAP
jgi:zinc protease